MTTNFGNPPQPAPSRTFAQILVTQPWVDGSGRLTQWAAQFLDRLQHYIGAVNNTEGQTISEQLTSGVTLNQQAGLPGTDAATQQQIMDLAMAQRIQGAPPLVPWNGVAPTLPQIMAREAFRF